MDDDNQFQDEAKLLYAEESRQSQVHWVYTNAV